MKEKDVRPIELAILRAAPLVNSLTNRGVGRSTALGIALECVRAIEVVEKEFTIIHLAIDDHLTRDELTALLADHYGIGFFVRKPLAPTMEPAVNTELLAKLAKTVEELELSVLSTRKLRNAGFTHVIDIIVLTEDLLLARRYAFKRKSMQEIKEVLGDMGLSLGMKLDDATIAAAQAEINRRNAAAAPKP